MVPELPAYDSEKEKDADTDQETCSPSPALMSVLDTCRAAVDLIMSDTLVGEHVVIDADTEEDMYTRGYLLCWDLLLTFFKSASSEVIALSKPMFIQHISSSIKFVKNILPSCVFLCT